MSRNNTYAFTFEAFLPAGITTEIAVDYVNLGYGLCVGTIDINIFSVCMIVKRDRNVLLFLSTWSPGTTWKTKLFDEVYNYIEMN